MRIAFLGESFVNGTGDEQMLGWVGRVCAAIVREGREITCYNLGIRREISDELRARWRAEVDRRLKPDMDPRLVFSFGVNDTTIEEGETARRVPLDRSLDNARAMLTEAAALAPVLMVGPPPLGRDSAEQNARIADLSARLGALCAELGVPFVETCATLIGSESWADGVAAGDGAHPRAAGYAEMADIILASPVWQRWVSQGLGPEAS